MSGGKLFAAWGRVIAAERNNQTQQSNSEACLLAYCRITSIVTKADLILRAVSNSQNLGMRYEGSWVPN